MNTKLAYYLILIISLVIHKSQAQNTDLKDPIITPLGNSFAYSIDINPTYDKFSCNRIEVYKSGECIHTIQINQLGMKGDIWIVSGKKFMHPLGGSGFFAYDSSRDTEFVKINVGNNGYMHGSWISKDNYVGKVKINQKEALYFRNIKNDNSSATATTWEAWIDAKNRTPLCFKENGLEFTYTPLTRAESIAVPPEVKKLLENQTQSTQQLRIIHHP